MVLEFQILSSFSSKAKEVKLCEIDFNSEFISRMIPKLDWPALCKAAENVLFQYSIIYFDISHLSLSEGWAPK